ncbi:MAG: hypothetical protein U9O53_06145, partial [archaeon]|nr:hypothetical protein [archaeon]
PDAGNGIYKTPLTLTFSDNVGNDYTSSEIISLIVGGIPDVFINVEPDKTFLSGSTGSVRVNIINKGLVDVKSVTLKLTPTDDFELLSNAEVYIGNVDSDDYDSADFSIHVVSSFSGELAIPVEMIYMSANNIAFEKVEIVKMNVYTQAEAESLGLVSASSTGTIYAVLAFVLVGYLVYRWHKKKKKKKHRE